MVAPAKGSECAFTGILAHTGSSAAVPPHSTTCCWPRWLHRRFYRVVASELGSALPGGASVLDVGTGPGRLLLELAQGRSDLRLVGVDPSGDMIRRARNHARTAGLEDRIEFETVPAESLPFPGGTFDLVLSTLSAHHWADPGAAINEQARALRPGGQLRIYDLQREGLDDLTPVVASAMGGTVEHRGRLAGIMGSRIGCLTAVKPAGKNG
jgi:ubiquinone/menaquinone biosynthesis C-methylase UbiE